MLIERHRQNQQNGLTASVRGGKPPSTAAASSSDRSSSPPQTKTTAPSGPALGDDAAAWNRLLMDNGAGENENDDGYGYGDGEDDDDDDGGGGCDRRFSSVSLNSIQAGSDEDDKLTTHSDGGAEDMRSGDGRQPQLRQVVVSRLEVSKTKVKRKRRKSWTGPVGRQGQGDGTTGPCRKGHSLDQGYETTHHHHQHREFGNRLHHHHHHHYHHHHPALYRSFSSNAGGDAGGVTLYDGCGPPDGETPVNGGAGGRQFRTPSVVVSDHSEDPVSFSSMFTLDDLGEFEYRPSGDCGFNDSSSDCSAASTWSAAGSVISVLDADYSLHTPERKISGCSTCSTFSGAEDDDVATAAAAAAAAAAETFGQSKPKPK
ncbi:PREDICTED: lateral signaling target protein 2 homolog, partial [Diuraphis noxia]|uniref:lateral signaling target protein 2 homolog n=1 Tax=Diuraphis noxia TaxID=143948 RepID=UPI0007637AA6